MNRYLSLAVLLCAAALGACEENAVQDITGPAPSARIKFFNFGVNAPQVNFYANDTKMTAVGSSTGSEAATGVSFGSGSPGGGDLYTGIAPGQYTFSGRIAAATDKDLPISNVTATIADGKQYSFFQSGFYNTAAKTVDGFIVEDAIPAVSDFSTAHVRFVHVISNANPMTLYLKNQATGAEIAVGGAVPYKSAGAFTAVPVGTYDAYTRYAGATRDVIVRPNLSFAGGRVYTMAARGDITVTSATSAIRPFLDRTFNR